MIPTAVWVPDCYDDLHDPQGLFVPVKPELPFELPDPIEEVEINDED